MVRHNLLKLFCLFIVLAWLPTKIKAQQPSVQSQNIIFAVDTQTQITTMAVSLNITTQDDVFYGVLALPTTPLHIEPVRYNTMRLVDAFTQPIIDDPYPTCDLTSPAEYGDGGYFSSTDQEPTQMTDDKVANGKSGLKELSSWGLPDTYTSNPDLQYYLDNGWYILAMREHLLVDPTDFGFDNGALPTAPIAITFSGSQVKMPVPIGPGAQVSPVESLVWILADQQYRPQNSPAVTIDFSQIQGYMSLVADIGYPVNPGRFSSELPADYPRLRQQTLDEYGNSAFVVEMAQPIDPQTYIDKQVDAAVWSHLLAGKHYLTRLYALLPMPTVETAPVFVPVTHQADVPYEVDLSNWLDPFDYWRCSSRDQISPETEANLPPEHRYIPELKADIAYPTGWQMTVMKDRNIAEDDQHPYEVHNMWVFAPRLVSQADFDHLSGSKDQIPMLVLAQVSTTSCIYPPDKNDVLLHTLGVSALPETIQWESAVRYEPILDAEHDYVQNGMLVALVAASDDWSHHQASYDAMLQYAAGYQFFTNPEFRHTLFLGDSTDIVQIPFPADWTEYTQDGGHYIAPAGSTDLDEKPYIRLRPVPYQTDGEVLSGVIGDYSLDAATTLNDLKDMIPFSAYGREGYVFFRRLSIGWVTAPEGYIIEVSAPVSENRRNPDLLTHIRDGIIQADNPLVCLG